MQSGVASLPARSYRAARGDEIAEFVTLQDSVNRQQLIIPPFVTVGPQPLEGAAQRLRAPDHGASMGSGGCGAWSVDARASLATMAWRASLGQQDSTFCHGRDSALGGNTARARQVRP